MKTIDKKDFQDKATKAGYSENIFKAFLDLKKRIDDSDRLNCVKCARMKEAILALGKKMDADATAQNAAVTGSQLDTDYEATIKSKL